MVNVIIFRVNIDYNCPGLHISQFLQSWCLQWFFDFSAKFRSFIIHLWSFISSAASVEQEQQQAQPPDAWARTVGHPVRQEGPARPLPGDQKAGRQKPRRYTLSMSFTSRSVAKEGGGEVKDFQDCREEKGRIWRRKGKKDHGKSNGINEVRTLKC